MNYYELFRYNKADGGKYSDIDISTIDVRYKMMLDAIKDSKSLVPSGSKNYAELLEAEASLKTAYEVLSDKTKRASYDASLEASKGVGGSVSRKVCALVAAAIIATITLGGCSVGKAPEQTVVTTEAPDLEDSAEEDYFTLVETPQEEALEETETVTEEAPAEEAQEVTSEETLEETETVTEEAPQEETLTQAETPVMENILNEDSLIQNALEQEAEMEAANITNPVTGRRWTFQEIYELVKFMNGVFKPATVEEVDLKYFDALNFLSAPLSSETGSEYVLYHILWAGGNDDYYKLIEDTEYHHINFADLVSGYERNGAYPLMKWLDQKRYDIYTSKDRDEVNAIFREVGQLYADIQKGKSATIIWDGNEYTFNSQEILGDMASSLLYTIEFQQIMANHYQIFATDDHGNEYLVEEVPATWLVYNPLNSSGVDENGHPIIKPDEVTLDEMNDWLNNGCLTIDEISVPISYWQIETVLHGGQTFGRRVQSNIEGVGLALVGIDKELDSQSLTH